MFDFKVFLITSLLLNSCLATQDTTFILPQGTGPFSTSLINEEWVDTARLDPFNSSHVRRIMISRYDPVPRSDCKHLIRVPYATPGTLAVEDEILAEYDYPKGLWARFYLQVCSGHQRGGKGKWPLALFSPGYNTTRLFSGHFAQEIASHGFTVITIDHPYETDVVEFPNGDVILGGHVKKPSESNGSTAPTEHALEVRAQDASFVLDYLGIEDEEEAVMFGQSLGGAASATSLLRDQRFRAGVNVDGAVWGPPLNTSLGTSSRPQAFMQWGSDNHAAIDPSWAQFWATLNSSAFVDYKKEFSITNTTHASYWDLTTLVDIAGIRDGLSDKAKQLIGPIPALRVNKILGRYIPAFFWYTLGKKPEDELLKRPSEEFPEVNYIHS